MFNANKVLTIAHRGSSGEAPENTMAAFERCLEQGSDGIELDIHLSKDHKLIVCHDETVNRTTNGLGFIRDMDAAELKKLDAGSWFSEKFKGETLPLLEEVFELVPRDILINIEIKNSYKDRIVQPLLDSIAAANRMDNIILSSFDHKLIKAMKLQEPRLKIGILTSSNLVRLLTYIDSLEVDVYSIHPDNKWIDKEDIQEAVGRGLKVYPYTIDSDTAMREAIDSGVSGIMTNFPARLKQILQSEKDKTEELTKK